MYIDTHCHLNFKAFNADFDAAILRAEEKDVKKFVVPGSNLETSLKALEIAKKYKNVFGAVGLHPIHVKDETFGQEFEKLAKEKKIVAIGETGLDYYHSRETQDLQKEVFVKHLNLARLVNKPIILHNRDAGEDILSILTGQSSLPKGVVHCFSENWDFAQVLLAMGFYISFTGVITFTKNYETLTAVKNIPLGKILIETDSPYLTPENHRGERNEPAFVIEVAKKIAEIKKISLEEVETQTTKNAENFFGI